MKNTFLTMLEFIKLEAASWSKNVTFHYVKTLTLWNVKLVYFHI